jgi:hypothetical protein
MEITREFFDSIRPFMYDWQGDESAPSAMWAAAGLALGGALPRHGWSTWAEDDSGTRWNTTILTDSQVATVIGTCDAPGWSQNGHNGRLHGGDDRVHLEALLQRTADIAEVHVDQVRPLHNLTEMSVAARYTYTFKTGPTLVIDESGAKSPGQREALTAAADFLRPVPNASGLDAKGRVMGRPVPMRGGGANPRSRDHL